MRDVREGRKFGRERDQRKAFLSGLASALILADKIKTTEARAKELRMFVEPLITKAREDTLHSRRILNARLSLKAAEKISAEAKKRFEGRPGGYTRITRIGKRQGDAAPMVYIEFVA